MGRRWEYTPPWRRHDPSDPDCGCQGCLDADARDREEWLDIDAARALDVQDGVLAALPDGLVA